MRQKMNSSALILGLSLIIGLGTLGYFIQKMALSYRSFERVVTVKGLAEKEFLADTVVWPIQFSVAGNDLSKLISTLEEQSQAVSAFLTLKGVEKESISFSSPSVIDKKAQQYVSDSPVEFRYLASQTVTVYSHQVEVIRSAISKLGSLGKQGIVLNQDMYGNPIEYSFNALNEIKPAMVEEATKNARDVAQKFARDSQSSLGKIQRASQGQFTISNRDSNTPYIKKVRVVSTVSYYLND